MEAGPNYFLGSFVERHGFGANASYCARDRLQYLYPAFVTEGEGGIVSLLLSHKFMRACAIGLAGLLIGFAGLSPASAESGAAAPEASDPAVAAPDVYTIVALGDSISAGYEPGLEMGSVPYGYVERLYEQALFRGRAQAANYGIIGLRVEGLNRLLQGAADQALPEAEALQDFSMFPRADEITAFAQTVVDRADELPAALKDADLVTVTIGGNDFRPFLTELIARSTDEIAVTLEQTYPQLLEQYTSDYETALRQIAKMAPRARIAITDQYLPLSELILHFVLKKDPALYGTLYEQVVKPLTEAVDGLASKLQTDGLPVIAVHVADRFKGAEGRMTHINEKDNHPTQDGYQAIAEAFAAAVWPEYRKPAPRAADVPISVIIRGQELVSDYKPTLVQDRTFLALRDVSDAMGADLAWDEGTKTAGFRQDGREVSITIGAKAMLVNGVPKQLDAPAYIREVTVNGKKEGKTYVPLAVIADGLGYQVVYSKKLQTAFINR